MLLLGCTRVETQLCTRRWAALSHQAFAFICIIVTLYDILRNMYCAALIPFHGSRWILIWMEGPWYRSHTKQVFNWISGVCSPPHSLLVKSVAFLLLHLPYFPSIPLPLWKKIVLFLVSFTFIPAAPDYIHPSWFPHDAALISASVVHGKWLFSAKFILYMDGTELIALPFFCKQFSTFHTQFQKYWCGHLIFSKIIFHSLFSCKMVPAYIVFFIQA